MNKPFIIPLFIPHAGCSHRCLFCDQSRMTGFSRSLPTKQEIEETILSHLKCKPKNRNKTQVAFFGGNFLGLPVQVVRALLEVVRPYVLSGDVDDIRCSTRPDTIAQDMLAAVEPYPIATVEIGAQSMDDEVLKTSNRGHTARDTEDAVRLLKRKKYEIGIQMMVGLPGDTEHSAMNTAQKIVDLMPDFVRIYPTIVLSGSPLAGWYNSGRYEPMSLGPCVSLVKEIYLLFRRSQIPVIRMGVQPTADLQIPGVVVAGPFHPSLGHLVYSEIFLEAILSAMPFQSLPAGDLILRVHPKNISVVRGIKNQNIVALNRAGRYRCVRVSGDDALEKDVIIVNEQEIRLFHGEVH